MFASGNLSPVANPRSEMGTGCQVGEAVQDRRTGKPRATGGLGTRQAWCEGQAGVYSRNQKQGPGGSCPADGPAVRGLQEPGLVQVSQDHLCWNPVLPTGPGPGLPTQTCLLWRHPRPLVVGAGLEGHGSDPHSV